MKYASALSRNIPDREDNGVEVNPSTPLSQIIGTKKF